MPGIEDGAAYKYHIVSRANGYEVDKADPLAFREQPGGGRASVVWDIDLRLARCLLDGKSR